MDSRTPDYTNYPETVSGSGFHDAPELAIPPGLYPHVAEKIPAPFGDPSSYDYSGKQVVTADQRPHGALPELAGSQPWYKRRRTWAIGLIAIVVVMAVVVGAVVGVNASRGTPSSGTGSSPTPTPSSTPSPQPNGTSQATVCNGTVCPQVLSFATLDNTSYLFAVGKDQSMWYTSSNGSSWTDSWSSLGSKFLSQPSSLVWNSSTQLELFGVSLNGAVIHRTLKDGNWSGWEGLGGKPASAVVPCRMHHGGDRVDIWIRSRDSSDESVAHDYWDAVTNKWFDKTYPWDASVVMNPTRTTNSTPAIACRDADTLHDAVIYDRDTLAVLHRQYSSSAGAWMDWNDLGGTFVGDPVVVASSEDRIDFFGIGFADRAMYHFSWTSAAGHSSLENLGGSWASVPSVVASSADSMHVVALDRSGMLRHRALVGSAWAADWDDMNVTAASAPLAVALDSSSSRIGVFVLDSTEALLYATYEVTVDGGWERIDNFESINGNLTSSWI